MEIYQKYKAAAYLNSLKADLLLLSWEEDEGAVRRKMAEFFQHKKIFITYQDIQNVILEIENACIDMDMTIKVVIQKANFNKQRSSINSGVTTKLVFLLRTLVDGKTRWYMYGLGSGLYNSTMLLNVTKSNPLGYTVYLSIFDKDSETSRAVPTLLERLRIKIANNASPARISQSDAH